jgi:uncharacterized protein
MGAPVRLTVANNPEQSRYEVYVDDERAGYVRYLRGPGYVDFLHTEVDPKFEGQGVGSRLAAGALDDVRASRMRVVATCPFIAAYLRRHPEQADLLADP